jgi:hypothetical protein
MQRVLSVTELSPGEFVGRLDQMITVYAAAMRPPAEMLPGRRSIMAGHAAHRGFRALLATEDGSGAPAGFGYGFHGAAGQWWHDTVARALAAAHCTAAAASWLEDSFEVAASEQACCSNSPRAGRKEPPCCRLGTPTRRPGGCTAGWASATC